MTAPLLEVSDVCVDYRVNATEWLGRSRKLGAVRDVDLTLDRGETLGLVGESGCGKSTLARAALGLVPLSSGVIRFDGEDISTMSRASRRELRKRAQLIFQDPYSSLNSRLTVAEALVEPLRFHRIVGSRKEARDHAGELLEMVQLPRTVLERYPNQLSGGQRQRVAIARALTVEPELLVADEPVSSLDVSIRGQIIELLVDLRDRLGLTMLFISHDLAVVRELCQRLAVMYLGRIVEEASAVAVFQDPQHPYSQTLIDAIPEPEPLTEQTRYDELNDSGDPPSPIDPPPGCAFHPRCPVALPICSVERPDLFSVDRGHRSACWLNQNGRRAGPGDATNVLDKSHLSISNPHEEGDRAS